MTVSRPRAPLEINNDIVILALGDWNEYTMGRWVEDRMIGDGAGM